MWRDPLADGVEALMSEGCASGSSRYPEVQGVFQACCKGRMLMPCAPIDAHAPWREA